MIFTWPILTLFFTDPLVIFPRCLTINEGRDGRVLIHCHAGCKVIDILKAINLKTSDLYPPDKSKIVEVYQYADNQGDIVYEIVRLEPKGFYARHEVDGRYVNNMKGVKLIPYRLPELIQAVENGKTIILVEGEKDADNVVVCKKAWNICHFSQKKASISAGH